MIQQDKFGRPLRDRVWKEIQRKGTLLVSLGYSEAGKKPNLFFRPASEVCYFADLRGTELVPIWEDTSALVWLDCKSSTPSWKRVRLLKQEIARLIENQCLCRVSYHAHESLTFDDDGNILGGDGICLTCGKDFQADGNFCSAECEKEYFRRQDEQWQLYKTEHLIADDHAFKCQVCGGLFLVSTKQDHHISYAPEEKIRVCPSCHTKIHRSDYHPELRPKDGEAKRFYQKKGTKRKKRVATPEPKLPPLPPKKARYFDDKQQRLPY